MTEETAKTKETMTINGVQHIVEDMTPEQTIHDYDSSKICSKKLKVLVLH